MPTYLYSCPHHGEFEVEHSITKLLTECPKCKEENIDPPNEIVRLINSKSKAILKDGGCGWEKNGYS